MIKKLPLRTLLLMIVVIMSAVGLGISAVAVNGLLRDSTMSRVDDELYQAMNGWAARNDFLRRDSGQPRPPTDFYLQKIFPNGTRIIIDDDGGSPDVSKLQVGAPPITVDSIDSNGQEEHWRAAARSDGGVTTIVAKRLDTEQRLLDQLMLLQMIISTIVLAILAFIAWLAIRTALRPLREVEKTAAAIAGGDLDRRVPEWPETTEVGQLSKALNIMLGQLQKSLVTAQSKEQQMRRFVGDASHELRTPLTSVKGYAELYRSGAMRDADKVVDKISTEAGRMSLLVEDLLALTRAEGTRLELKPVDALEVSLGVAGSMRAIHSGHDIQVRNLSDEVPLVYADPSRLHQVMTNLVNNAIVHGGADAQISIGIEDDWVNINVIDNGVGMEPEVAEHVFDRFYRADSSRSRESGGSGLGLAIVKTLTEAQNGTVTVTSEPGEGSTFSVRLPRARAL